MGMRAHIIKKRKIEYCDEAFLNWNINVADILLRKFGAFPTNESIDNDGYSLWEIPRYDLERAVKLMRKTPWDEIVEAVKYADDPQAAAKEALKMFEYALAEAQTDDYIYFEWF